MSGISRSRRWIAAMAGTALLATTAPVATVAAQSAPNGSVALSSGSSAGSSSDAGDCEAVGNESCTADNGSVEATVGAWVGHEHVDTTLEITGLRSTSEDISVSYSAEGLDNVLAASADPQVDITIGESSFTTTIPGGLEQDETVRITISADLIDGFDTPRNQSLSVTSATQTTDALNTLPTIVFAALGIYALIEHAHNMRWLPKELDQLLYQLTGRDPALSPATWSLF